MGPAVVENRTEHQARHLGVGAIGIARMHPASDLREVVGDGVEADGTFETGLVVHDVVNQSQRQLRQVVAAVIDIGARCGPIKQLEHRTE